MMGRNTAPGLAIHLLGDFRILVRGHAVEDARWARPQARLLVKLLALDPRHQLHCQQLVDAIWPDLAPGAGAANLHKIIHQGVQRDPEIEFLPDQRSIIQLTYFGGLSARAAARQLGLPVQTVRREIQAAMRRLRDARELEGLQPALNRAFGALAAPRGVRSRRCESVGGL